MTYISLTDDIYLDRYAHRTCWACSSYAILKLWKLLGIDPAQLGLLLRGSQQPTTIHVAENTPLGVHVMIRIFIKTLIV